MTHAPPGGSCSSPATLSLTAAKNVLTAAPTSTGPIDCAAEGIKMVTMGALVSDTAAKPSTSRLGREMGPFGASVQAQRRLHAALGWAAGGLRSPRGRLAG